MVTRPTDSKRQRVFHDLIDLAYFYAMRSCEYLKVPKSEDRRTDPIRKKDITFIKNHRIIPHSSPDIATADAVSINFTIQKNAERDDVVTQSDNGDPIHSPVKAAARIIQRMEEDGLSDEDYIYTYKHKGKRQYIDSPYALRQLRAFIRSQDYAGLGIHPDDIGLHSIRSSAAMGMYLNHVPVYTIMLLGRWSSDAFLRYIRKQVEQFSSGVSKAMIQTPVYHHVPMSRDDPRTRNNPLSAASSGFMSLASRTSAPATRAVFSVWG